MRGPGLPWINPKDEIEADALAVENRFKSRHQIIRERGGNPAIIDEEIKADEMKPEAQNATEQTTGQAAQGQDSGNGQAGNDQKTQAA
jgi:capsid protein